MGLIKRKGRYEYNRQWHQDWSALIVPKAAEAALVHGKDIREFITNHPIDRDFYMRAKVPRASTLVMRWPDIDVEVELNNIIRYYVSKDGGSLFKKSPPTGENGSWKRKPKVSDSEYNAIIREIRDNPHSTELDSLGIPHDTRIHTGNKSKHTERIMGISVGWKCTDCSDIANFDRSTLNYEYYISEAEKIVKPLLTNTSN